MLNLLIALVFGILYGLWRRCYGGWDSRLWEKWFPKHGSALHRNFWRAINLILVFCLMFFYKDVSWEWALYTSLIMQFIFWDWTFGMYMHIGRGEYPNEDDRKEYSHQVFGPFLNWIFEERQDREWNISVRYGDFYDFLGMLLRYSAPGLLLFFVPSLNIGMCFIGTLIALSYLVHMILKDKEIKGFLVENLCELMAGFFTGFIICII